MVICPGLSGWSTLFYCEGQLSLHNRCADKRLAVIKPLEVIDLVQQGFSVRRSRTWAQSGRSL